MGQSARVFVDFWNFQISWNERSGGLDCDWKKLPAELIGQTQAVLNSVGLMDPLNLDETLVYASVKPSEVNLKRWLQNFLDRQPSVRVTIRERRTQTGGIWCNVCKVNLEACPHCQTPFERAPEKGIDTAIVTDLLSLAWEAAFDVAILVTSDADFIPAVEKVQERGLKVINATWAGHGFDLAHKCWGQFALDNSIVALTRPASTS